MGDVDVQIAAYAPFISDLARDLGAAQQYYMREEYKKDNFVRGKELDKKLRDGFGKLDEMSDKLGAALEAWRKEHPIDPSKMDEGEKLGRALLDDARNVFMTVVRKKIDGEAWKAALDKLDKSSAALKAFADGHPADNWSKIMAGPVDAYIKTVKGAKITADKTFDADNYLLLVTHFTGLLDARQRAVSRRPSIVPPSEAPAPAAPAPAAPAPAAPASAAPPN